MTVPKFPMEGKPRSKLLEPESSKGLWEPKSCCCGCSPRTGTLIFGWLVIIGSALQTANMMRYASFSQADFEEICEILIANDNAYRIYIDICPTVASGVVASVATVGVICFLSLIVGILLVVGVNKNKHKLMVPYLVTRLIQIIISILLTLAAFVLMIYFGNIGSAFVLAFILGGFLFLEVYFLLVARVCYKEVKSLNEKEVSYQQQQIWEEKAGC